MLTSALRDPTSMKLMYTPAASKSGTKIIATRPKRWPNSAAMGQVCSDELSFVSGFKTPSQNAIAVRWVAKVILSNKYP